MSRRPQPLPSPHSVEFEKPFVYHARCLPMKPLTLKNCAALTLAVLGLALEGELATPSARAAEAATISGDLSPQAVLATMKAVANWQLAQPFRHREDDWTCAALYTGIMALSQVADDPKYHDAMMVMGQKLPGNPAGGCMTPTTIA